MAGDEEKDSVPVLVVDDNADFLAAVSEFLKLAGYSVRTAADGLEGFEAAEEMRPSTVFMDLGMPRMDGYEAARYIRRQPWGKDMQLVAVSGWGQAQHKQQSREAGFDLHLVKPVQMQDLLAVLEGRGQ